jgi:hypothetical protein
MDYSKLASLSIGLAAFLGGLWLVLQIIKTLRRNNHQAKQPPLMIQSQPPRIATSGEQSTDYWQARFQSLESKVDAIAETLDRIERSR